jgi:hypothetical protein
MYVMIAVQRIKQINLKVVHIHTAHNIHMIKMVHHHAILMKQSNYHKINALANVVNKIKLISQLIY